MVPGSAPGALLDVPAHSPIIPPSSSPPAVRVGGGLTCGPWQRTWAPSWTRRHRAPSSPLTLPPCSEGWRRAHLWSLAAHLGSLLDVPALSPIIPLVLGGEEAALEASMRLLEGGRHVPAIRPPTVPPGTCR